jgi:sec-independent protein translocase protein TatC
VTELAGLEARLVAGLRPGVVPPAERTWAAVAASIGGAGVPGPEPEPELEMTLVEHLDELRSRLIRSVGALVVTTAIAFVFTPTLFQLLLVPAPEVIKREGLIFIEPTEAFLTYFQVSLMTGIGLASPVILYQLLAFVLPGLTVRERRVLFRAAPAVLSFFVLGVGFGYFVTLPLALTYLIDFNIGGVVRPMIRVGDYLGFVTTILFWMGIAFETPVVIFVLSRLGILDPRRLGLYRKYAILVAFVLAAVITPTPDPLNQSLVAIPLWILYEIGILLSRFA